MKPLLQRNYPLLAATALLGILLGYSCYRIVQLTGGPFCYPLDDAFIHMAVAKNFGLYGIWGVNHVDFSSASSSPLYTVLLAFFFRIGITSYLTALLINIVVAILLLRSTDGLLRHYGLSAPVRTLLLFLFILLLPMPVIILTGMEHLFHLWFTLLFLQAVVVLVQPEKNGSRQWLYAAFTGALMVSSRFEGLFILGPAVLLLLYHRRVKAAFGILILSLAPLIIFGAVSVWLGGYILPNSVLLKSSSVSTGWQRIQQSLQEILVYRLMYGNNTLMNVLQGDRLFTGVSSISGTSLVRLLVIVPLLVILVRPTETDTRTRQAMNMGILFTAGCLAHLALAAVGWMFRYEAYLVGTGVIISGILLVRQWDYWKQLYRQQRLPQRVVAGLLIIFVASPLVVRTMAGYRIVHRACRNIYEQQYQMGAFLKTYYPEVPVAAHDIGAVSFLSDSKMIDIWGLGHNAVAKSRLNGQYNTAYLQDFLKKEKVKIAVIYNDWYEPALYNQWTEVANWTITDNVVCAMDKVHFYALDPQEAPALLEHLKAYQQQLPSAVAVQYLYNSPLAHE